MGGVEVVPKRLQLRMDRVAPEDSAAEECVMAVSQYAGVRMLAEILPKPHLLRVARGTPTHSREVAIRVEYDDVPNAQVVTVVPLSARTCLRFPILKVRRCEGGEIFMIP